MGAMAKSPPLPFAPDRSAWGFVERSELGVHGACDVVFRSPGAVGEGAELPPGLTKALPLLMHDQAHMDIGALPVAGTSTGDVPAPTALEVLVRVLPRLLTWHWVDSERVREFSFALSRPSSLHVLARVMVSKFRFRLEDLSAFVTHGELLLEVLHKVGLRDALDPEAILYCPALDSPYPFKFVVVGRTGRPNRDTYLEVLNKLLRQTETDEAFRGRMFREVTRGFQKFGPAAATPKFQEVELRVWRILSYLAARLRVKAGRLTDTAKVRDPQQVRLFLDELRHVNAALDDLMHLPSRIAAQFRSRFDLEMGKLHEQVLPDLDAIARRIDCDPTEMDRSVDAVASLVSTFRRLGSVSPLESLEEKDREIQQAYGNAKVEPLETGWARTYTETIFTGAERFDTRRFGGEQVLSGLAEEDMDLDLDLDFGGSGGKRAPAAEASDEASLSDSNADWRVQPGAEWSANESDFDLDSVLGGDDGQGPAPEES
jgi:hypothetical protein